MTCAIFENVNSLNLWCIFSQAGSAVQVWYRLLCIVVETMITMVVNEVRIHKHLNWNPTIHSASAYIRDYHHR